MVRYDSLNCGDVFLADGAVWMRTDSYEAAVVNLETGIADDCFDSDEIVEFLNDVTLKIGEER